MNNNDNNMSTKVTHAEHSDVVDPAPPTAPTTTNTTTSPPGHGIGIDDHALLRMAETVPNLPELVEGAQRAAAFEHSLTLPKAVRLYSRAMVFSMIMSLAIIMEGYDTSLLSSFYGYPTFQKRFGYELPDGTYQVSSKWQSGLSNGGQVGQILGLMTAGILADRFGYRKTILGAMVLMIAFIFVLFFAQNIGMLFAGSVLCGLPWGAFQTLTTTYAADVSPTVLRPYLTTYVNLCWVMGQFIAVGVVRGLLGRTDDWSWRIPYAIQWVWPIPIIVAVIFAPESPYWLVRKGKLDEAKQALRRLSSNPENRIDDALALIVVTNEQEKLNGEGVSYWDCFKGTDLRRTEITCAAWVVQVSCGIYFAFNIVYFLEQAGFAPEKAFDFGVGINAVGFVGTLLSWWIMQYVGRRKLYIAGLSALCVILLVVGFIAIPSYPAGSSQFNSIGYASGSLLLIWIFVYDISVGPVCYSIVAEIPSTRLRIKTVVLARTCYNIVAIGVIFLNPAIVNPTAWNLKGKGGFIWGGICFIGLVWTYFRLPEPRGRTPAELDVLFEQKVSARKFHKTKVDLFLGEHHMDVLDKAAEAQD